ncbi:MAG: hypothetical protein H0U53_11015 [Actinobacteria bacterium]|nr:hypothetical protein [Actinomycetota bacterium]
MDDIRNDPRWDSRICVNCGGIIGCEFCPRIDWTPPRKLTLVPPIRQLRIVPIIDRDAGDENDHPDAA